MRIFGKQNFNARCWAWLLLLLGIAGIYLANYYGLGLTGDSYYYLQISHDYQLGGLKGVLQSTAAAAKPPLYGIVLAWFNNRAGLLNLLSYSASFLIFAYWALSWIESRRYYALYCGLLAIGTPLILVHCFLWTEPLFMPIMGLFIVALQAAWQSGRWPALVTAGLLASLLCAIRHAGILVVVAITLSLIMSRRLKRSQLLLLLGLGALFFLVWFALEPDKLIWRLELALTPYTEGRVYWYGLNVVAFLEGLALWFIPLSVPVGLRIAFSLALLLGLAGLTVRGRWGKLISLPPFLRTLLGAFLLYYGLLHLVYLIEYYTAERYLLPFFPVVMLIGVKLAEGLARASGPVRYLILGLGLTLLTYNGLRSGKNIWFWQQVRQQPTTATTHHPAEYRKLEEKR